VWNGRNNPFDGGRGSSERYELTKVHFFTFAEVEGFCPEPKEKWTAGLRPTPPDPANCPISVFPLVCITDDLTS
jgi:hypothetical protein